MGKSDTQTGTGGLLKVAEKNHIELQKSWKKVEELDAAIQAAQRPHGSSKTKRKEK
jgi:hypothetical protein